MNARCYNETAEGATDLRRRARTMIRVVLRRSVNAPLSVDAAACMVRDELGGAVLSQDDRNLLAEVPPAQVPGLQHRLEGWTVAPQTGERIPVPDTRLKVRGKPAD